MALSNVVSGGCGWEGLSLPEWGRYMGLVRNHSSQVGGAGDILGVP